MYRLAAMHSVTDWQTDRRDCHANSWCHTAHARPLHCTELPPRRPLPTLERLHDMHVHRSCYNSMCMSGCQLHWAPPQWIAPRHRWHGCQLAFQSAK